MVHDLLGKNNIKYAFDFYRFNVKGKHVGTMVKILL